MKTASRHDPAHAATLQPSPEPEINERQSWILSEVERGIPMQRTMVERKFNVVGKTAQRDLAELSRRGDIEYVQTGRAGYYQRS